MWIICQAEDSPEISRLVFFEKVKNRNKCRLLQILLGALRAKEELTNFKAYKRQIYRVKFMLRD